jgi:hypothetical protein
MTLGTGSGNHIFDKIGDGRVKEPMVFDGREAGNVYALLARDQTSVGETVVITDECEEDMDWISPRADRNVGIVARAGSIWLRAALNPRGVARLTDGEQVRHAHERLVPKYVRGGEEGGYLVALGQRQAQYVEMNTAQHQAVLEQVTFPDQYADMVRRELTGEDVLPQEYRDMAASLAKPIMDGTVLRSTVPVAVLG